MQLTWWELCAVVGLVQTVYLLVYLFFRARNFHHILIPVLCFGFLGSGFLSDFAVRYLGDLLYFPFVQGGLWACLPAVSVLLIAQVALLGEFPARRYWAGLAFPAVAIGFSWLIGGVRPNCTMFSVCDVTFRSTILSFAGGVAGAASFLLLWGGRSIFAQMGTEKSGQTDRYWLIISLIVINLALMAANMFGAAGAYSSGVGLLIRDIFGFALVYLASTSLLRIYPQSVKALKGADERVVVFSEAERSVIQRIESLLELDKVYQEPSYSRADMAREVDVSEAVVSKLVNAHFGKTVPQLLNERRVKDAEILLQQTTAPISVIAEQVGFNSLATFNRAFKDITGRSPSDSRVGRVAK